jgi:hypothetical protein
LGLLNLVHIRATVGDVYVKHGGYLETADTNNIVVLFPQVVASLLLPQNPVGCWDWWGYDDGLFADEYGEEQNPVSLIDCSIILYSYILNELFPWFMQRPHLLCLDSHELCLKSANWKYQRWS